jgi:uncharacterized FlgJ-related protein
MLWLDKGTPSDHQDFGRRAMAGNCRSIPTQKITSMSAFDDVSDLIKL